MNRLLRWVTRSFHDRLVDFRYGAAPRDPEDAGRMAEWEVVVDRMRRVGREPARERLARLAEQAVRVGAATGRGPITVCIDDGDASTPDPERWTPIWATLIQAVRAAVQDGLEDEPERVAKGKPARGYLWLRAFERGGDVVVEIEDDGRGVAPSFPALEDAVAAAGGRLHVECVPEFGTVIRIEVPAVRPASRSQTQLAAVGGGSGAEDPERRSLPVAAGENGW